MAGLAVLAQPLCADEIDDYVRLHAARNHLPAVSLAIVRQGTIEKLQSYGIANLEWNTAATVDTTYQLASATKVFTGTLLMMLVEQAQLSLDDDIARFFSKAPAFWRKITIRQLASHTSGLKEFDATKLTSVSEIVKAAMEQPLAYEPGTQSAYGFVDFVVLAAIMEQVSGKPYDALLRDLIVKPLGMRDTAFTQETEQGPIRLAEVLPRRAPVYRWDGDSQKAFNFLYSIAGYAAGGLHSSAADLAKFFIAIEEGRLLKGSSLEAMWTPARLSTGEMSDFGLGWVVRTHHGRTVVGHSGGPALADLLYVPSEKLAVVVLTNQQRLFPYLADGIADFYLPPPPLSKPMTDREPALTTRLRSVLADAAQGKVNPGLIAGGGKAQLVRTLEEMGPTAMGVLDPIKDMELIEERREAAIWMRTYRVWFGRSARYWRFELSSEGRIVSARPVSR
jgi:CubicO group peptidase (beta-lactamase class C family)